MRYLSAIATMREKREKREKPPLTAHTALFAHVSDPRPDLAEDTGLWALLLAFAFQQDSSDPRGLYGALHAFRCVGTRLAITDGRARLVRPSGEDEDPGYDDYAQRHLTPHLADLRALLGRLVEAAAAVTA